MKKTGTFLCTHAEADSAILRDVTDGQVHTLGSNPGVEEGDAIEGTLAPEPPMEVSWQLVSVERRWQIPVERSDESPTKLERDLAADQEVGGLTTRERAGIGEIHVLTVEPDMTDSVVEDVLEDGATLERAARLGVNRVEIRAASGVVAVRYLP
ncbi:MULTISPECIES: DUF5812 family protein [unclassified Haladaptatus]|uniref:DUF5812 family protein n=1 Tax=unclassified Haladaptatus TaxID=2622732 RepID=UPI0023E79B08|nr:MULTISPECIES: DUF5812 family protein [unclassified Haladaptatus]